MTVVRFEPSGYETSVKSGTPLVDVTDEHPDADVPYSCRSASCGTCRVEVVSGVEGVAPPEEDELEVLEVFGNEKNVRLCCQLRLDHDVERLVLRVCDPV